MSAAKKCNNHGNPSAIWSYIECPIDEYSSANGEIQSNQVYTSIVQTRPIRDISLLSPATPKYTKQQQQQCIFIGCNWIYFGWVCFDSNLQLETVIFEPSMRFHLTRILFHGFYLIFQIVCELRSKCVC